MKFDSHVKVTGAALRQIRNRCPAPLDGQFQQGRKVWMGSDSDSGMVDNWSAIGLNIAQSASRIVRTYRPGSSLGTLDMVVSKIFPSDLSTEVAMIDVSQAWTHGKPFGQRYHFQRTADESSYDGYQNALGFIHFHTSQWVSISKTMLRDGVTSFHLAKFELAHALHALQDSFSTGHTVRSFGFDVAGPGGFSGAAPIIELTAYSEQDKSNHADHDYASGHLSSGTGRHAVDATVDLILMGIASIASPSGLVGWDRFVAKWLGERIARNAPAKVAQNAVKTLGRR